MIYNQNFLSAFLLAPVSLLGLPHFRKHSTIRASRAKDYFICESMKSKKELPLLSFFMDFDHFRNIMYKRVHNKIFITISFFLFQKEKYQEDKFKQASQQPDQDQVHLDRLRRLDWNNE